MDSELIRIQQREEINDKNLIEESRKAVMLAALYTEKTMEIGELNDRQKRFNKNINQKRREMERMYVKKAKEIVDGKYRKKRPSILSRVFAPHIIFYSFLSIIVYICLAKLAYMERGYKAIGGEGFFLILPIILVAFRIGNLIDKDANKRNK